MPHKEQHKIKTIGDRACQLRYVMELSFDVYS